MMGSLAQGSIAVLLFCVFACGSSQEKTAQKPMDDSSATSLQSKKDTLPPRLDPAPPSPAPGTVNVEGLIMARHGRKKKSKIIYDFKVLKILGVGSSAPAIVVGDTLQMLSSKEAPKINKHAVINCTVRYQEVISHVNDSTTSRWQLLDWKLIRIKNK